MGICKCLLSTERGAYVRPSPGPSTLTEEHKHTGPRARAQRSRGPGQQGSSPRSSY